MKLLYKYMAIFFSFSPTSNHLHPLQVENCDSDSRLVVDKDDNGKIQAWYGWSADIPLINHGNRRCFFQLEIIINYLVGSFVLTWIPMLWVYGYYQYFYSYSAGIDTRRQNLPSEVDPRTVRVIMKGNEEVRRTIIKDDLALGISEILRWLLNEPSSLSTQLAHEVLKMGSIDVIMKASNTQKYHVSYQVYNYLNRGSYQHN